MSRAPWVVRKVCECGKCRRCITRRASARYREKRDERLHAEEYRRIDERIAREAAA